MAERKTLSKKTRFEVFKRDAFTCQYCGSKAPDVILVVDHVKPVAAGGDNDLMNLITSCQACNAGKGARELSDMTVLEKQRKQLEELNERREQLEMMIEWREGLNRINETALAAINDRLNERTGYTLNEHGMQKARKWLRQYGLAEVLEALEIAFDQYAEWKDGQITSESWNIAWNKIPRIINVRKSERNKPYLRDLFYIRGILRNRLNYVNERVVLDLLERAYLAGASIENLKDFAKSVRSWSRFEQEIIDFLEENEKP